MRSGGGGRRTKRPSARNDALHTGKPTTRARPKASSGKGEQEGDTTKWCRSPSSSNRMHDGFVGSRERDRISWFSWLSGLSGLSRHPSLERDASHRQFTGNQPRVFCGRRGRASGRAPFIRRCHRRIISPAARCVGLATKPNIGRQAETNTWLACVINTPRNDFEKNRSLGRCWRGWVPCAHDLSSTSEFKERPVGRATGSIVV